MKAQKVDDVRFQIEQDYADVKFDINRKKGELYLSLSDLFFTDGNKWYDIPLDKLQQIEVSNKQPLELEFRIPSLRVRVEGDYAEKLLALRHLLLPYINGERNGEDPLLGVLKLWGLGINEVEPISDLLSMEEDDVKKYMGKAKEEGMIEQGELTDKGKKVLNGDGEYLDKLEE